MPEELLWHIFRCLAFGLEVVENGNELIDDSSWNRSLYILTSSLLIVGSISHHSSEAIFQPLASTRCGSQRRTLQDTNF